MAVLVDLQAGTASGIDIGNDTLVSIENVEGGLGNDTIRGDAGANRLLGGDGDDRLAGRGGDDLLDGGNGSDTAGYALATQAVLVDLQAGTASGIDIGNDTLVSIENVEGGLGDDIIRGDAGANRLLGGTGDDRLAGRGGDDVLDGGDGSDTAGYALSTQDVMVDLQAGTASGTDIGNDTLVSIENVEGGLGDDIIRGDAGANRLLGGTGDDRLAGRGGDDLLDGGDGSDTAGYALATQAVLVDLQAGTASGIDIGNDTLVSIENVDGGFGNDNILGDAGANRLVGGDGNDRLVGRGGDDVLDGGAGIDTAGYAGATQAIVIDLQAGTAGGQAGNDMLISIENADGGSGNDIFLGDASANRLAGAAGNDRLAGRGGNDVLDGGTGSDTADYAEATQSVFVDLTAGRTSGVEIGTDTLISIENVGGGSGNDDIRGDAGANRLAGAGGDDTLSGGQGADRFVYESGADIVLDFNREEGDRIDLTNVPGVLSWADVQAAIIDPFAADTVLDFGGGNTLTLNGVAPASLVVSDFLFPMVGDDNDNTLVGTAGIDAIRALDGNDTLQGLAGDDVLDGGSGIDRAVYSESMGGIVVDLAAGTASGANIGNDALISIEDAMGGAGPDALFGSADRNVLLGGAGPDLLVGRGGDDLLDGGASTDIVNFAENRQSVFVDLQAGTASGIETGNDTLVNIESVNGGSGNDSIFGDAGANALVGFPGDDRL